MDNTSTPTAVPTAHIQPNPYQPRKRFDDDELKQLTASVRQHGVLQPLVVRAVADGFQLIAGERRLRAAQAAGLAAVPVHVVRFDEQQVYEAALAENIQRSDLNPIEKAAGFKDYLDKFKLTHDQLGAKLGIDRSSVSNLVGLLALPADVQDAVRTGQLSLGHAKVLKSAGGAEKQSAWARRVVIESLSVAALDAAIKADRGEGQRADRRGEGNRPEGREDAARRQPGERPAAAAGVQGGDQAEGQGAGPDRHRVRDRRRLRADRRRVRPAGGVSEI